ncbi:gliding motility lipoprotein GldB [Lutibacter sp.]
MNRYFILLIILFSFASCKKENKTEELVSKLKVKVLIDRFDTKYYNATPETFFKVKQEYPYLFPSQTPDSVWINKINDSIERTLFEEAQKVFPNFEKEKPQIANLFQHVKYYHPSFKSPKIITLITNLDYQNRVIYADSLLFVSLDLYLGKNNTVYQDFPEYLSQNFDKSQLVVDMAKAISEHYFIPSRSRQFLHTIIDEGKKMYLIDSYLPAINDAQKMGWNNTKLAWAQANEVEVWKYFIENKLLYSTNAKLYTRFVANAPFSKFYMDLDKESPGKIGVWVGWQIVRAYMKNNHVTLQQLLQTNADDIFLKSKYKPRK